MIVNTLAETVTSWAIALGASELILLDSFNLGRRMTWVRGNPHLFPTLPVELGRGATGTQYRDDWISRVAALHVGESIDQGGWRWVRTEAHDAWTSAPGVWLAQLGASMAFEVTIRNIPGRGVMIRPLGDGKPHLDRDQCRSLKVLARREELQPGGM